MRRRFRESGSYTARLARKRTSAGVLFTNPAGHVLLVEPTYKCYWDLPGGCVELAESPIAAAERELKEELGVVLPIGRVLVIDWVPPRPDLVEALMFVFDGGTLDDGVTFHIDGAELRSWAWCTPDLMAQRLQHAPMLERRIAAACQAKTAGTMLYLESGWTVPS